jgi:hypothetical protein
LFEQRLLLLDEVWGWFQLIDVPQQEREHGMLQLLTGTC